jgi:uncharacterized membrane protein YoaK (UPF0700 family)
MENSVRFKPGFITIPLIVTVAIVLLLTLLTGRASIPETITYILTITFLSFLTADLKKGFSKNNSPNAAYKYVLLIFLLSFLTLM